MTVQLPEGFCLGTAAIRPGDDRHVQGRRAAMHALAALLGDTTGIAIAYDGTRPVVTGADVAISITHTRTHALAVAAPVRRLGIDLCDDDARLADLAERYLAAERSLATTPEAVRACFAAKEAALKALGLGLLDGGAFDGAWGVRVVSLDPPRLEPEDLELVIGSLPEGTVAIAYAR